MARPHPGREPGDGVRGGGDGRGHRLVGEQRVERDGGGGAGGEFGPPDGRHAVADDRGHRRRRTVLGQAAQRHRILVAEVDVAAVADTREPVEGDLDPVGELAARRVQPRAAADALTAHALDAGGRDNVTVVCIPINCSGGSAA